MKLILTEKVRALGNIGEIVEVSAGYARNFLIPKKFAVVANEGNKKFIEDQKARLAKKIEEQKQDALKLRKKVDGLTVEFFKRVAGNGKLFGTVTAGELSQELAKKELDVEKRLFQIQNPIKQLGTFEIPVKIFTDVIATLNVKVSMDPKQVEENKKKQALAEEKKKALAKAAESQEETKDQEEKTEEESNEEN